MLYYGAMGGKVEMVGLLVSHGADVNKADKYSEQTPLYVASKNGHSTIVEYLKTHGAS